MRATATAKSSRQQANNIAPVNVGHFFSSMCMGVAAFENQTDEITKLFHIKDIYKLDNSN